MAKLPQNPSAQDYQKYYDDLPSEQQPQFLKSGLLALINSIYTDGAEEVMQDETPLEGSVASGKFVDKRDGQQDRVFKFQIIETGGEYELIFQPLSE